MLERSPKKQQNNAEKIFTNHAKPHGRSILAIYIIDTLLSAWLHSAAPLTVYDIQQAIKKRTRFYFYPDYIRLCLNNLHLYSSCFQLETVEVQRGTNKRVKAFCLNFKSHNNECNENAVNGS